MSLIISGNEALIIYKSIAVYDLLADSGLKALSWSSQYFRIIRHYPCFISYESLPKVDVSPNLSGFQVSLPNSAEIYLLKKYWYLSTEIGSYAKYYGQYFTSFIKCQTSLVQTYLFLLGCCLFLPCIWIFCILVCRTSWFVLDCNLFICWLRSCWFLSGIRRRPLRCTGITRFFLADRNSCFRLIWFIQFLGQNEDFVVLLPYNCFFM